MKVGLLIDGGYLRATARRAGHTYNNQFIESFAHRCILQDEYLLRVYYYDAPPFEGEVQLPVSGETKIFEADDRWLIALAKLDRFAVRRGKLGFRGWRPRNTPLQPARALRDSDFAPNFEQKGVDMRIGLDIANFSQRKTIDRVVLVSGDQDMIPAMKQARKSGLEVVCVQLSPPTKVLCDNLQCHADMIRTVTWD